MITLKGVSKSFGAQKAVENISLEANDKEILVLLGTSGCGKTTTLKMINRLIEPDSGSILINGKNIKDKKPEALRKTIGFVMQHAGLFPHYTVAQNIAILPDLLKWDAKKTHNRIIELLEKLNLPQTVLARYPHELSGGQQQRVGIARALIADTPVLLMDEPFGALDNITKTAIHKEFRSLDELTTKTTVLVTHDVQEAFDLGHRICLMDKGQIVQTGTPHDMLYRPANDFVKNFFASGRLVLEYKIATLKAVEPYLKAHLPLDNELAKGNVWQALETLGTETRYTEDHEALIRAFNHYRKLQTA
jgi:osmoprotectant transport system ATP-binding protein